MKFKHPKKYRITIKDESHLTEVASRRVTLWGILSAIIAAVLLFMLFSGMVIAFTPLRNLLPGYLKDSQRSATEDGLLRLDSLMLVYERNQAYIDNYLRVTDTNRIPEDSVALTPTSRELTSDSLMTAAKDEQKFVSQMEERERFNISVLAPLAADGLIFSPVTGDGIFTAESVGMEEGIVLMPREESVRCAADGSVIALYYSHAERGYAVTIQHNRGFVTSYTHVGAPIVGVGDIVSAGQIVALSPTIDSKGKRFFKVRMWHNGLPISPSDYLASPSIKN